MKNYLIFFSIIVFTSLLLTDLSQQRVFALAESENLVPDQYIVVLKDGGTATNETMADLSRDYQLSPRLSYSQTLRGFSAHIPREKLTLLETDPRVAFVSQDRYVSIARTTVRSSRGSRIPRSTPTPIPQPTLKPKPVPTPSLSFDQASLTAQVISNSLNRIGPNQNNHGSGIGVAIVDTGIELNHPDLAANIVADTSCIPGATNGNDDNGHGTHLAGIVAAANNDKGMLGVASEAKLIAVKSLSASGVGTWSTILCGIDWITANASKYNIKVANLSFGGYGPTDDNCGYTNKDPIHQAICRSRDAGVIYVAAAGNSTADADHFVPAGYNDAVISVSALADSDGKPGGLGQKTHFGPDDTFASFSNYGASVDLAAPGVDIFSTWIGGKYRIASGTSMAAPHVAGAVALYLATHPGSALNQVMVGLRAAAEAPDAGHTDPKTRHGEPLVLTGSL